MIKLAYLWNSELSARKTGTLCPEVSDRCTILNPLDIFGTNGQIQQTTFQARSAEFLELVHTPHYIEWVRSAFDKNIRHFDSGDTRVTQNSYDQAV
ncbi:MAG: hypothetical protein KDD62_15490, partial [Bdellovibrionales bacterium]|nr:hypothetical protein [Bdellovibrionales bacterium]